MGAVARITTTTSQFTAQEIAVLVDLIENKLDDIEVIDHDDRVELRAMQGALAKLLGTMGKNAPVPALRLVKGPYRR